VKLVLDSSRNIITVTAKDPNGNAGIDKILVHYSVGSHGIMISFSSPPEIGPVGNSRYSTDKPYVNVSGHASYDTYDLVEVSWVNTFTGESGTAWQGGSHSLDFNFSAPIANGGNLLRVIAKDSHGHENSLTLMAICTYTPPPPGTPLVIPSTSEQNDQMIINMVGAAALILILAGLFLRFVFDVRLGWVVSGIGAVLLVIFFFLTLQQPPM